MNKLLFRKDPTTGEQTTAMFYEKSGTVEIHNNLYHMLGYLETLNGNVIVAAIDGCPLFFIDDSTFFNVFGPVTLFEFVGIPVTISAHVSTKGHITLYTHIDNVKYGLSSNNTKNMWDWRVIDFDNRYLTDRDVPYPTLHKVFMDSVNQEMAKRII